MSGRNITIQKHGDQIITILIFGSDFCCLRYGRKKVEKKFCLVHSQEFNQRYIWYSLCNTSTLVYIHVAQKSRCHALALCMCGCECAACAACANNVHLALAPGKSFSKFQSPFNACDPLVCVWVLLNQIFIRVIFWCCTNIAHCNFLTRVPPALASSTMLPPQWQRVHVSG